MVDLWVDDLHLGTGLGVLVFHCSRVYLWGNDLHLDVGLSEPLALGWIRELRRVREIECVALCRLDLIQDSGIFQPFGYPPPW